MVINLRLLESKGASDDLFTKLVASEGRVTHDFEQVHAFGTNPDFRRRQLLADSGHAFAQALDFLLHVATHCGVVLLPQRTPCNAEFIDIVSGAIQFRDL